jgi:hypothetical protein
VSKPVALLLTVFSIVLGPLLVFFGFVELRYPDVGPEYATLNTIASITAMIPGVVLILAAIGAVRGSLHNKT